MFRWKLNCFYAVHAGHQGQVREFLLVVLLLLLLLFRRGWPAEDDPREGGRLLPRVRKAAPGAHGIKIVVFLQKNI